MTLGLNWDLCVLASTNPTLVSPASICNGQVVYFNRSQVDNSISEEYKIHIFKLSFI